MPDRYVYVPELADIAARAAQREKARYAEVIARIRKNPDTSKAEKRALLNQAQTVLQNRLTDLRRQRNAAYEAAERNAIERLCRPKLVNRFGYDSYFAQYRQLRDAPMHELEENMVLAELLGDQITGHAIVTICLRRRLPDVPGDKPSQLISQFCNWRLPNGSYTNAEAATGWEMLQGLQRTTAETMAELAVYSTSNSPEPLTPPGPPPDPRQTAAEQIAAMYPAEGNGSEPSSA